MGTPRCPECGAQRGELHGDLCPAMWAATSEEQVGEQLVLPFMDQVVIENLMAAEKHGLPVDKSDPVNLPEHYARFKIEPIRFICENGLNFFQGNIVKYVLRHDAKNGLEDLRKAQRYLAMWIAYLEGNPDWWKL